MLKSYFVAGLGLVSLLSANAVRRTNVITAQQKKELELFREGEQVKKVAEAIAKVQISTREQVLTALSVAATELLKLGEASRQTDVSDQNSYRTLLIDKQRIFHLFMGRLYTAYIEAEKKHEAVIAVGLNSFKVNGETLESLLQQAGILGKTIATIGKCDESYKTHDSGTTSATSSGN